jgi:signal transduction histidine kinase
MNRFGQFEDAWKHGNVQLKIIVGELRNLKEETAITRERDAEIISELKQSLRSIDPKFEALYDGAYEALRSENKERLRHAVVSMRELLKLVIDRLGVGETRKQKVMSILCTERAAELVDSLAEVVEHVLNLQSKEMKEVEPNYDDTVFAIKTGEYTLHYLLTRRPKKNKN